MLQKDIANLAHSHILKLNLFLCHNYYGRSSSSYHGYFLRHQVPSANALYINLRNKYIAKIPYPSK